MQSATRFVECCFEFARDQARRAGHRIETTHQVVASFARPYAPRGVAHRFETRQADAVQGERRSRRVDTAPQGCDARRVLAETGLHDNAQQRGARLGCQRLTPNHFFDRVLPEIERGHRAERTAVFAEGRAHAVQQESVIGFSRHDRPPWLIAEAVQTSAARTCRPARSARQRACRRGPNRVHCRPAC